MKTMYFQDLILSLQKFWQEHGCTILQPLDLEVGAGTFHPATFIRSLGDKPWNAAYVQSSRRPTDGRYAENPNRLQMFHQFQVLLKPAPLNIQQIFLDSLRYIGIDPKINDIRFVEDNWESPTLGAWGLGWEVWQNGMEIVQYTYFQQAGGVECKPVSGELAYGLERIAMLLQNKDCIYDVIWNKDKSGNLITYGDIFKRNEYEMCHYNFSHADVEFLLISFDHYEKKCQELIDNDLIIPAYELNLKASHTFNLLDSRGAISVTERKNYILRIRKLSNLIAKAYTNG